MWDLGCLEKVLQFNFSSKHQIYLVIFKQIQMKVKLTNN
jgi:hypothetical protein